MRLVTYFLIAAITVCCTACLEIAEHLYLNRDGSGRYLVSMDLSKMMANPLTSKAIQEEMGKDGQAMIGRIDSVGRMIEDDQMPAGLTAPERVLLSRATMHIVMDQDKDQLEVSMEYPFADLAEFDRIQQLVTRVSAEQKAARERGDSTAGQGPFGMMSGLDDLLSVRSTYDLGRKQFTRQTVVLDEREVMDDEELATMKMFLEGMSFTSYYHLPGRVKKTTFAGAEIVDKHSVKVSYPVLDMFAGKVDMSGSIRFK